jgi:hypothetical protein
MVLSAASTASHAEWCFHGSFLYEEWELRVTTTMSWGGPRPLAGDELEDLLGVEIVKAFIARRRERHDNTREVTPLTSEKTVWRLARGHDHRGATWYDQDEKVIWLLAYEVVPMQLVRPG